MGLTFFGLTPEYRLAVFTQIHDIVFYGKGGYDWETVYNMPLWLRRFTYSKLYEHYIQKESESSTDSKIQQGIKQALIERQAKEATYTAKASKK